MENRVITIARSYGSGGRKMGRLLAKELGYEYYDREILRIASDESGISEELFNQVDERQHLPLFRIAREAYTGRVCQRPQPVQLSGEDHPRAGVHAQLRDCRALCKFHFARAG